MRTRVAINGLGRIGRAILKLVIDQPSLELVAINDLMDLENLAYLLRFDTVYGRYQKSVIASGKRLTIAGHMVTALQNRAPADLPWTELGVDLVFECTGRFTRREDLEQHVSAGARIVLLSAPSGDDAVETIVHGVNSPRHGAASIIACASCTTNCITPVVEIVGRRIGVRKAVMTTVHSYTSSQALVDGPNTRFRRGRAAAGNLVPTTTGAARATARALPFFDGLFDGIALRAPTLAGAIADITFVTSRKTSVDEVNRIFAEEAASPRYTGIVGASRDPLVSSDIIGDARASVVDLDLTRVIDGDLVKVMSWYDNEWGYANQMVREALAVTRSSTVAV
jgi:glyceraldehyde 3-phosphate dehydrogenase